MERSTSQDQQKRQNRHQREYTQDSSEFRDNRGRSRTRKPLDVSESTRKLEREKQAIIQQEERELSNHSYKSLNKQKVRENLEDISRRIEELDIEADTIQSKETTDISQEEKWLQDTYRLLKETNSLIASLSRETKEAEEPLPVQTTHDTKIQDTDSTAPSHLSEGGRLLWEMQKVAFESKVIFETVEYKNDLESISSSYVADKILLAKKIYKVFDDTIDVISTIDSLNDELQNFPPLERSSEARGIDFSHERHTPKEIFDNWIHEWPGAEEIRVQVYEKFGPQPTEALENILSRHIEESLQIKRDTIGEGSVLTEDNTLGSTYTDKGNKIKIYDWPEKAIAGPLTRLQEMEYLAKYIADKNRQGKIEMLYPVDIAFNSHRLTFSDGPDDPIGHIDNDSAITILKDNNFHVIGTSPFLRLRSTDLYELPLGGQKSDWGNYNIEDVIMYLDNNGNIKYSGFISKLSKNDRYDSAIVKLDPYGVFQDKIDVFGDKWIILRTDRPNGRHLPNPTDLQAASTILGEAKLTELYIKMRAGTYSKEDIINTTSYDVASMYTAPEDVKPKILDSKSDDSEDDPD